VIEAGVCGYIYQDENLGLLKVMKSCC